MAAETGKVIGKVFILQGTAKAVAPDGTVRILGPNSVIYADERIVTESDGAVSIMLDGPPPSQIDLGRMSDVLFNEDVYAPPTPAATKDATAQTEEIEKALESGEEIELEATAAGAGGAGGSNTIAQFTLDGAEGLVNSGAETTGVGFGVVQPLDATVDTVPIGGIDTAAVDEDGLIERGIGDEADGDHPAVDAFIKGTLSYDFKDDGPAAVNPFVWSTDGLEAMGVTSQGHDLLYEVSEDGLTLTAYYMFGYYPNGEDTFPNGQDTFILQQMEGYRVDVFSVTVTDVATGAYEFWLYEPLDHAEPGTEDDIVYNFTYTLTDGDGSTGTGSLAMTIDDDMPVVDQIEVGEDEYEDSSDTVTLEDEKMPGGLDEFPWFGSDHEHGTIINNVSWGADGFGKATLIMVGDEEFDIPEYSSVTVYWAQDGTFLGTMGEDAAASLKVSSDGTYKYKLLDNMLLGEGIQGEQIDELATVKITGVDGDGDPAAVNVTLQVQDDMPFCLTMPDIVIVEDEKMDGGIDEKWDFGVAEVTGTIVNNAFWGADGFGSAIGFTVDGEDFSAGDTVYWDQYGNLLLPALQVAAPGEDGGSEPPEGAAASLVVNENGTYTYTLLDNVLLGYGHQGEQINLLDKVTITAEDADGDRVDIDVWLKVQDDVPSIHLHAVNESSVLLTTQDAETIGEDFDTATSGEDFSGVFSIASSSYGADGPGETTMSYSLNLAHWWTKDSGLDSNGANVNLYKVGNDIIGSTAGKVWLINESNTVFKLSVDDGGTVTLTQYQEIHHADNDDTSAPYDDQFAVLDSGLVKLTAKATIIDADGDKQTDSETIDLGGNIRFADDGLSGTDAQNVVMANVGDSDPDADITATASLGLKIGADLQGATVQISDATPPEGTQYVYNLTTGEHVTSDGQNLIYVSDGQGGLNAVLEGDTDNVVFSITPSIAVDGSTFYTTTLYGVVDHATRVTEETEIASKIFNFDAGNYDPNDSEYPTSTQDDITLTVKGYVDEAGTHPDHEYDNVINTPAVVNISAGEGGGIGVAANNINNWEGDGLGDKLVLNFDKPVMGIKFVTDQLDDGETAHWEASNGTTSWSGNIQGTGTGASTDSDEVNFIGTSAAATEAGSVDNSFTTDGGFTSVSFWIEGTDDDGKIADFRIENDMYIFYEKPVVVDEPIVLDFKALATDGDHDTLGSSTFTVTLDGDAILTGGAGSDVIVGSSATETIFANDGAPDIIDGGGGGDIVFMDPGLDTLIDPEPN